MAKDLVFIASAGRTGTQFFGRELSRVIEDCYSVHEPDILFGADTDLRDQIRTFGLWHMIGGRLLGTTGVRVLGHRLLEGSIPEAVALRRIAASRGPYFASLAQSLVVESNGQWWYLAHRVTDIWPGAKLVSIIRDPRTWVRSWRNKQGRYDQRDWAQLLPPGRLTPRSLRDAAWAERWDALPVVGKLAWEWKTVYSHLEAAAAQNPNQRMFRFEDVFAPDGSAMRELVEFVATHGARRYAIGDLGGFASTVRNASKGDVPDWQDWPDADVRLVEEICGELMRRHGYGLEPDWRARAC